MSAGPLLIQVIADGLTGYYMVYACGVFYTGRWPLVDFLPGILRGDKLEINGLRTPSSFLFIFLPTSCNNLLSST
jgi:hypothetical protein